jgi:hypothetical protein
MALTYNNRRGETHYFKAVRTKNGSYRYYITKKDAGSLIDEIPKGFEIYEHPKDAKVVLRKKIVNKISEDEIEMIREAIKNLSALDDFLIDVKGNVLTVYFGRMNRKEFKNIFPSGKTEKELETLYRELQTYIETMRFVLEDEKNRRFTVQRWCYLGSINDWIDLETSDDLKTLAEKYCDHLGKESYFELEPSGGEIT